MSWLKRGRGGSGALQTTTDKTGTLALGYSAHTICKEPTERAEMDQFTTRNHARELLQKLYIQVFFKYIISFLK
jgi:hypothetical protein